MSNKDKIESYNSTIMMANEMFKLTSLKEMSTADHIVVGKKALSNLIKEVF